MKISFDENTYDYIQDYMEQNNIRHTGDAIAKICKEHQEKKNEQSFSLNYISEVVSQNLHQVLKSELNKIRLGANSADKKPTQILIELMNGLYFHQGVKDIITTGVIEQDGVKTAREFVEEKKIKRERQKKMDWESTRNNVT
jgi:hypothetical protein